MSEHNFEDEFETGKQTPGGPESSGGEFITPTPSELDRKSVV